MGMDDEARWTEGRYIRSIMITRTVKGQYQIQHCDGNGSTCHPLSSFENLEEVADYIKKMGDKNI